MPLFNDLTKERTLLSLATIDDVGRCCCCCVDDNGAVVNAVVANTGPSPSDPLDRQYLLFLLGSIVVEVTNR